MSASRSTAIFLAALMVASVLPVITPSSQAQSADEVPVPWKSAANNIQLHFERVTEASIGTEPGADPPSCQGTAACSLRVDAPAVSGTGSDSPDRESRPVRQGDGGGDVTIEDAVRFTLDTQDGDKARQGAQYPFTLKKGTNVATVGFWYESEAICTGLGGQILDFHVRLSKTTEPDPAAEDLAEIAEVSSEECGSPNTRHFVSVTFDLPQDVEVAKNEHLAVEIWATNPSVPNLQWTLLFGHSSYDSRITLKTDQAVEQAVWATSTGGAFKQTFNPTAPSDNRLLVGNLGLRSAFGPDAVPAEGLTGQIRDPAGNLVDLNADASGTATSVPLEERSTLRQENGTLRIFRFSQPDGFPDQPWSYPSGVEAGAYTIDMSATVLDQLRSYTATVAMGSFAFELGLVDQEESRHTFKRGTSTTFLLQITNPETASATDSYEITATQNSATADRTWSVTLLGVDQNDRLSLAPGETGLLQVKLTPPSEARTGELAAISVTAESQASGGSQTVDLEGEIIEQTVRQTGLLVLKDPFTVGIDRENRIQAYVWNQGSAVDGFTASIPTESLSPNDPDRFTAQLGQTSFDNVDPGAVVAIPIDVTTTNQVSGGNTFSFDVNVQSTAQPAADATGTINTVVEAIRSFDFFALRGTNEEATSSLQFGKLNRTQSDEDPILGCTATDFCGRYTNVTYHRFTLTNTGDQHEDFNLALRESTFFDANSNNCANTLPGRLQDDNIGGEGSVAIIGEIDHQEPGSEPAFGEVGLDPGETARFFLRVPYDGHTDYNVAPNQGRCTWESWTSGVRVTPENPGQGFTARTIETTTRVYAVTEQDDLPQQARGQVALLEDSVTGDQPIVSGIPDRVGLTPGEAESIPFTLSMQDGHSDQATVTVGPRNIIENLRDAGWTVELVPIGDLPITEDGDTLTVPEDNATRPHNSTGIGHSAGAEYQLELRVTPPTTGLQENERHSFTIQAQSQDYPAAVDSLGINVQIGEEFDFELDQGTETVQAHAGDTVAFGLTIQNVGASRDEFTVTTESSTLTPTAQPSTLQVSPLGDKTLAINVEVPEGAGQGSHTVNVIVESEGNPTDPDDDISKSVTYEVDVRPAGTLVMTPEEPVVRVGPGGSTTVNYTIENQGADQRSVDISEVFAPPGWNTSLSDGSTVTRQVDGGSSITFAYRVDAPESIVEGSRYVFVVRAEDAGESTDFANGVAYAVSQSESAVALEPEDTQVVVDRGASQSFSVLVRNLGTGPTWYTLSTQFATQGWASRVLDQDGNAVDNSTVRVPEGTFKRVLIEVTAPNEVARDHVEDVRIEATAVGQADATDQVVLQAAIHDFAIAVDVEGATTKDAAPGDQVEYLLSITNEGNGEDTVSLSFEDADGEEPTWAVSTDLSDDNTPSLEPGETLTGVRVLVAVPSPNQGPVPTPDGVLTTLRATSSGQLPDGTSPTVSTDVTTKLVPYVRLDVDGDGAFELALDANRNSADGFEVFADKDDAMVDRGELASGDAVSSEGLYVVEPDGDDREEHLVDTDGDGVPNVYFDPDKAQTSQVPYTTDTDEDGQPEIPMDWDFNGVIEGLFDPASDQVQPAVNEDFSGDGRRDLLIDTNANGVYDTFVDPNADPHVVTNAQKDGDRYELDTDGDGKVDTYYNAQTQSIEDATSANLADFLGEYWYFVVLFALVVVLFVVIVVRRL